MYLLERNNRGDVHKIFDESVKNNNMIFKETKRATTTILTKAKRGFCDNNEYRLPSPMDDTQ